MTEIKPEEHIKLVHRILMVSFKMRPPFTDCDEFGDGLFGLMIARKNFKPELGLQFSTYAWRVIWSRIVEGRRIRYNQAGRILMSRYELSENHGSLMTRDTTEDVDHDDYKSRLLQLVSELPDRMRMIVEWRMNGDTLRDVSLKLDITRERVRQIECQAHRMILEQLEEKAQCR